MKVFVAALNWGLGHVTRIIPIIQQQVDKGNKVIIGASFNQVPLYKEHFPSLTIETIPGKPPVYSKGNSQVFSVIRFIPDFIGSIKSDNRFLKNVITKYDIDMVISDNRYGLWNKSVKSIIVTHQVNLKLPRAIRILVRPINYFVRKHINRFDLCYIPDFQGSVNIAGALNYPLPKLKCATKYIGPQSRLSIVQSAKLHSYPDLLILISGPEKQRSIFEGKILESIQINAIKTSYLIVRGITDNNIPELPNSINHTPATNLKAYIENAKYIICRAGYSSIMDLVLLNKTALLVPTPGQTEQEYLANYLFEKGRFLSVKQNNLNIKTAIYELKNFVPTVNWL